MNSTIKDGLCPCSGLVCFVLFILSIVFSSLAGPALLNSTFLNNGEKGLCYSPTRIVDGKESFVANFVSEPFNTYQMDEFYSALLSTDHCSHFLRENNNNLQEKKVLMRLENSKYYHSKDNSLNKPYDPPLAIQLPSYMKVSLLEQKALKFEKCIACTHFKSPSLFGVVIDDIAIPGHNPHIPFGNSRNLSRLVGFFVCSAILFIGLIWSLVRYYRLENLELHDINCKGYNCEDYMIIFMFILFCCLPFLIPSASMYYYMVHPLEPPSSYRNAMCRFKDLTIDTNGSSNPLPYVDFKAVSYYKVHIFTHTDNANNADLIGIDGQFCVTSYSTHDLAKNHRRTSRSGTTLSYIWDEHLSPLSLCYKSTSRSFQTQIAPFIHNYVGNSETYLWPCKYAKRKGSKISDGEIVVSINSYHEEVYEYWLTVCICISLMPFILCSPCLISCIIHFSLPRSDTLSDSPRPNVANIDSVLRNENIDTSVV